MTNKKWRALLFNLISFATLYSIFYIIIVNFTGLTGFWIPVTSFIVATILAPRFQAINYRGEEKLVMSWIFLKGIKEIK